MIVLIIVLRLQMILMVNKNWPALLFQEIGRVFYARGINYYNVDLCATSLHAEVDAVNNLRPHYGKRPKKVNIIVLRTNNKGDRLMLAKSCEPCMKYMRRELPKKGYQVQKAWYSNDEGDFTRFVV